MKPKPYEAQNTKFSEYERSSLIYLTTFELLKFENQTSVIIEISRFSGHRCPGINEGVFVITGFSVLQIVPQFRGKVQALIEVHHGF